MTTPFGVAAVIGLVLTFIAQLTVPRVTGGAGGKGGKTALTVGNGIWIGLLLSTAILWLLRPMLPQAADLQPGPSFWTILPASFPLLVLALISDFGRPRSERHAIGLLLTGLILGLAGMPIVRFLDVPLGPLWQVIATVLWLFLMVSIVELVSLVPLGLLLFTLALTGVIWASGGDQQSVSSYTLAGVSAGAVIGRTLADALGSKLVPWGKAEIFALGLWLSVATMVALLKSVAFAGFVLPLAILAVGLILISIQTFERTLLLRETPRSE